MSLATVQRTQISPHQYGAYATFWNDAQLDAAMVAVRAMVPANARSVREIVIASRCGCCSGPCPNVPGTFAMKWFA